MTSLEWVQAKKKLSDQENRYIGMLKAIGPGPRFVADDNDPSKSVLTARGAILAEMEELRAVRKRLKPGRRR